MSVFAGKMAVRERRALHGVMTMTLEPLGAFAHARAGQFVIAAADTPTAPRLGRPFSIITGAPLSLAFVMAGPGTRAFLDVTANDRIHVVGPLGRPFAPMSGRVAIVGDASHFGTLYALARERDTLGERADVVFVARQPAERHADQDRRIVDLIAPHARTLEVVTPDALTLPEVDHIAAGASAPVMARVQAIAAERGVPGQAVLHAVMGCGVGACHSCVHPLRDGTLSLVCEGPTFDLAAPLFGVAA